MEGLREMCPHPRVRSFGELLCRPYTILPQKIRRVRSDAPDRSHGRLLEKLRSIGERDDREPGRLFPFGTYFREHFGGRHADGERHAELSLEILLYGLCYLHVTHFVHTAHASEIRKTFVDGIFFDARCVAAYDFVHARGENTVGLVVRRQNHSVGDKPAHFEEPHAAFHPEPLCLIGTRRYDATLFARDDGLTPQSWVLRHLT